MATKKCSTRRARFKHGEARKNARSPEYGVWMRIRQRCNNPNCCDYPWYGGRGIVICLRWEKFENFLADMGRRPSPQHSIDREDNDKGYEPTNCCWASSKEQARNCSSNRLLTFRDRTQCLAAWAEELGLRANTIESRLRRGWLVEEALTVPSQKRGTSFQKRRRRANAIAVVYRAVKAGRLEKPTCCQGRGGEAVLQAHHHKGYAKRHRLKVIWLCKQCHVRKHPCRE